MADDRKPVTSESGYGVKIESVLNRDDGALPFAYYEPSTDGKLTWNCGYDQDGKITSVFCFDYGDRKDRKIGYITAEEAIQARDSLVASGWQKTQAPEVKVTYQDGEERPLTRKERRYLEKNIRKMAKKTAPGGDAGAGAEED